MKKLSKVVLAASMFAALFAGCSNGLVANDELAKADVEGYATENGVIILEWDDVKDAAGYKVYVKKPFTELYSIADSTNIKRAGGVNRYIFTDVEDADADYDFKIVATPNSSSSNLLSSETEVTVTTPEAFSDTAIFASSEVKIEKKANDIINQYEISFPANIGYDYYFFTVEATVDDAEVAYAMAKRAAGIDNNDNEVDDGEYGYKYDGGKVITETRENEDGDEYVVATKVERWVWINPDGKDYRLAIKAEPKNRLIAKPHYVLSGTVCNTLSSSAEWPIWDTQAGKTVGKTYTTTTKSDGTIVSAVSGAEFYVGKVYDEKSAAVEIDGSKYTLYRKTTTTTYKINALDPTQFIETSSTEKFESLGTATKDATYDTAYTSDVRYKFTFTETPDATDGTTEYSYAYYLVGTPSYTDEAVIFAQF